MLKTLITLADTLDHSGEKVAANIIDQLIKMASNSDNDFDDFVDEITKVDTAPDLIGHNDFGGVETFEKEDAKQLINFFNSINAEDYNEADRKDIVMAIHELQSRLLKK